VASAKGDGISCSENCIIQDSLANGNFGFGIKCGSDCIIRNNVVSSNVAGGISITSFGGVISENSLRSNQGIGISCTFGGTISGNAVIGTASNSQPGQMGIGISAEAAMVIGNTVTGSASYGLRAPNATTGYSHNVFTKNIGGEGGAQVSGGLNLGSNFCSSALCP
jgi:parallel beta-helix repeat protein